MPRLGQWVPPPPFDYGRQNNNQQPQEERVVIGNPEIRAYGGDDEQQVRIERAIQAVRLQQAQARPGAPHKIVKPQNLTPNSFEDSQIGDIFPTNPTLLLHADIKAFARHHPEWFDLKYKFRDPSVHVGLEVEVENVLRIDPQLPICFWSIHEDGSLRNRGREFKTWPMPLQYTEAALRQLFASLNDDLDFSKRTSIHVHVDVRQLTPSQIMGLLYTYAVTENLLFRYAGANRRNSIFCMPIVETDLLCHTIGANKLDSFLGLHNAWQKYTALNIKPLQQFGTVEFRQLPGTTNIQQILVWMDLLTRLRVFAYRYPLQAIVDQISELNTSSAYDNFVKDVFGELVVYLDTSNLLHEMEKACYLVKNSNVVNEFHHKVIKSRSKTSSFYETFLQKNKSRFTVDESKAILQVITVMLPSCLSLNEEQQWIKIKQYWKEINYNCGKELKPHLAFLQNLKGKETEIPNEEVAF